MIWRAYPPAEDELGIWIWKATPDAPRNCWVIEDLTELYERDGKGWFVKEWIVEHAKYYTNPQWACIWPERRK